MSDAPTFLADVAVVTGVAAVTGMIARACKQPSILGYLLAGLIVGPSIPIPLFADPHRTEALAEFGIVLVMFAVGLEFRVARLLRVLPVSGFTGLVQIATLAWAGFSLGALFGWGTVGAAFLGACLAISSTMVVSGIFQQSPVEPDVKEHVLGVLVVQDVVAIGLIAAMTALAAGHAVGALELVVLVARLGGFLVGMLVVGLMVVPRLVRRVLQHGGAEGTAVLAVGLAFGFALLAQSFGYSVALGAFAAGILVAESGAGHEVQQVIEPLRAVFAAIFFVSIGMAVDPALAWKTLPIAVVVAAVVIVAQLGSVMVASLLSGSALRRSVLSGLALGQIGELSFIIAAIGNDAGAVPDGLLPTLVTVATITSFTTPNLLRQGEHIVGWVDRVLPPRLQHLLSVHQTWAERLRSGGADGAPVRRALRAMVVDWLGLLALALTLLSAREPVAAWVQDRLALGAESAAVLMDLVAIVLALPLLIGLFRNARSVAMLSASMVRQERDADPAQGASATRLLEGVAGLVLVIGVGLPALALMRPLVHGPWGEAVVMLGAALASLVVWRNLGAMEGEFTSGVGTLARQLARHAGPEAHHIADAALLPGLDRVLALPLPGDAPAVGRTLAQLDLRAKCGATVVAIHKPNAEVILPTGHERLEAGDVLALAGATDAIDRARALLLVPPPTADGA